MAHRLSGMKLGLGAVLFAWAAVMPALAAEKVVPAAKAKPAHAESMAQTGVPMAKAPHIDISRMRDPFMSYIDMLQKQNKARMAAYRSKKADHPTQPLESFDLSALKLVAIMRMGEKRAAMVQDPEGKGYVVRLGSYIGRDNGRVVGISDTTVQILEDVFSPTGDLVKRKAALTLNEVNSQK